MPAGKDAVLFLVFFFVLFLFFFIQVIGDKVQMHGVRLRDFELGFAFGTAQNLAFLDFIFIHVDFGGTFRATNHWACLPTFVHTCGGTRTVPATCSVLYTAA